MRKQRNGREGFTLIELIAVIIILGILAAVITPKYFDLTDKAQEAALNGAVAEGIARLNMAYASYTVTNSAAPAALSNLSGADYLGTLTGEDVGDYTLSWTQAAADDPVSVTAVLDSDNTKTATKSVPWPD